MKNSIYSKPQNRALANLFLYLGLINNLRTGRILKLCVWGVNSITQIN